MTGPTQIPTNFQGFYEPTMMQKKQSYGQVPTLNTSTTAAAAMDKASFYNHPLNAPVA